MPLAEQPELAAVMIEELLEVLLVAVGLVGRRASVDVTVAIRSRALDDPGAVAARWA